MITWNVSPEILSIGPITLRWYGTLFALGFVLGRKLIRGIFIREKISLELIDPLLQTMIVGTVVGARLGHVIFYDPAHYLAHPLEIFAVWEGGLASHGASVGLFFVLWRFARKHPEIGYMELMDKLTLPTQLTLSLIRLGNLFNSEILGRPSSVPWAFVFPRVDNIQRHPTQLYESVTYALIFGFLYWLYTHKPRLREARGFLMGLFLTLTLSARLLIEFLKENQASFEASLPLNMGQILSIPLILLGIFFMTRALRHGPRNQIGSADPR